MSSEVKETKKPAAAAAAPAAPPAAENSKPSKLHPHRFKLAEYTHNIWMITPEAGVPVEAIIADPAYLSHVAKMLKPNDLVRIIPDDSSYFAEAIVRSVSNTHARLALLRRIDIEPLEDGIVGDHAVRFMGLHKKHTVIRLSDKKEVQPGFDTKEDALAWLAANIRSIAA